MHVHVNTHARRGGTRRGAPLGLWGLARLCCDLSSVVVIGVGSFGMKHESDVDLRAAVAAGGCDKAMVME